MRKVVCALVIGMCLWWGAAAPTPAQQPPPAVEKKDAEPVPRDGTSMIIYYALAIIGAIIVMVLVCMPVRRD